MQTAVPINGIVQRCDCCTQDCVKHEDSEFYFAHMQVWQSMCLLWRLLSMLKPGS